MRFVPQVTSSEMTTLAQYHADALQSSLEVGDETQAGTGFAEIQDLSAPRVRQLVKCLLELAEAEVFPIQDHDDGHQHVCSNNDKLLRALFFSLAPSQQASIDYTDGFCSYTLHRSRTFLVSLKTPKATCAPVCWNSLGPLTFQVVEGTIIRHLRLYASPGFLTMMEVTCRGEYKSMHQLGTCIFGSLGLLAEFFAVSNRQGFGKGNIKSLTACKSYLGTIIKLLLLLECRLEVPITEQACKDEHQISRAAAERFQGALFSLRAINEFLDGDRCGQNSLPVFRSMAYLGKRALLVSSRISVTVHNTHGHLRLWTHTPIMVKGLEAKISELAKVPCNLYLGCHNPQCMTLHGGTEAAMKTLLCAGCRRVRFCSRECQGVSFTAHKVSCQLGLM